MNVKRYDWEDALIEAESLGHLEAGAVNMCLRLAKAINWDSKGRHAGKPSGLYWKNEDALTSVGSSRATYFRYRRQLFEIGFFKEEAGNLIPQVPELSQIETVVNNEESHIETGQSQVETTLSHIETPQSQVDTPYSEDTYTEDVLSEDSYSKETAVSADASPATSNLEQLGKSRYQYTMTPTDSLNSVRTADPVYIVDLDGVTKVPQSQLETKYYHLTPGEKRVFKSQVHAYKVNEEKAAQALALIVRTKRTEDIYEAVTTALYSVGAVTKEEVEAW